MNELDKILSNLKERNDKLKQDPDSDDLKDWVLNWDRLNDDVKKTLEALKGQYGCKAAVEMYGEMSLMEALAKKQKRDAIAAE